MKNKKELGRGIGREGKREDGALKKKFPAV